MASQKVRSPGLWRDREMLNIPDVCLRFRDTPRPVYRTFVLSHIKRDDGFLASPSKIADMAIEEFRCSRRVFLGSSFASVAAGLFFSQLVNAGKVWAELFDPVPVNGPDPPFDHHYMMAVFPARCDNCGKCRQACRSENNLSENGQRISILSRNQPASPPFTQNIFLPALCNQCTEPPCVSICPTKASMQDRRSGIVTIDRKLCVGCRACMMVCPYLARYYDSAVRAVDGCDFCVGTRLTAGRQPACVESCPRQVLAFGDLKKDGDPFRQLLEHYKGTSYFLRTDKGTRPNVVYIAGVMAGDFKRPDDTDKGKGSGT